jgi:hypothetical protein
MLAGTIALMFSTFLNPFFAAGATAIVLGVPALASHTVSLEWGYSVPVYMLTATVMQSSFKSPGDAYWFPVILAMLETLVFWFIGAWIFARVDVAVAVE